MHHQHIHRATTILQATQVDRRAIQTISTTNRMLTTLTQPTRVPMDRHLEETVLVGTLTFRTTTTGVDREVVHLS